MIVAALFFSFLLPASHSPPQWLTAPSSQPPPSLLPLVPVTPLSTARVVRFSGEDGLRETERVEGFGLQGFRVLQFGVHLGWWFHAQATTLPTLSSRHHRRSFTHSPSLSLEALGRVSVIRVLGVELGSSSDTTDASPAGSCRRQPPSSPSLDRAG